MRIGRSYPLGNRQFDSHARAANLDFSKMVPYGPSHTNQYS